jgi:hypothetical protein
LPVDPLTRFEPVVDASGRPNQKLQLFSEEVAALFPIIGEGSPEGIYEAKSNRFYIDKIGGAGACLYVKVVDDIAGERKDGWVLV